MTNEMWANGKMDRARHIRVSAFDPMTLGCVGISMKRNERANEAQKAETAPGLLLESRKDTAKTLDFIDEALIS